MPPKKVKADPEPAWNGNDDDDLGQYEADGISEFEVDIEEVIDEKTGEVKPVEKPGNFVMPEQCPPIHYQRRTIADLMSELLFYKTEQSSVGF